jgi:LysR family transcriptional regulator, transcriptional activator for dmlA
VLNDPKLSDLRIFVLVVRHSSFVAASKELNLAQTTISKRISVLEETLGAKLLLRTTRTVKVTDEGIRVFSWAQKVLDAMNEMTEELAVNQEELQGPIRISASSRLGRDYVAPALAKLKMRFPAIDVWLEIMDRRVDLIQEGFHLDIRSGNAEEPNLIGHKIINSSRILCASSKYIEKYGEPQTPQELSKHHCLLFRDRNEPFGIWKLMGPKGYEEIRITGELASNDNEVVLNWAHNGMGIMMATDWFLANSIASGKVKRVLPNWHQPVDVWAISSLRTNQSSKVRLFIEYLKEEMKGLV